LTRFAIFSTLLRNSIFYKVICHVFHFHEILPLDMLKTTNLRTMFIFNFTHV
jgi:hypothetical protein